MKYIITFRYNMSRLVNRGRTFKGRGGLYYRGHKFAKGFVFWHHTLDV